MKIIKINGTISSFTENNLKRIETELSSAKKGEEIQLEINSPGGSVYEGIAIHNAIRKQRKSGNPITAKITGLSASMGSYIPLATDKIEVEDNAVVMIHNPWTFSFGDYRDMQKEADVLSGLAGILAKAYAKKMDISEKKARTLMDDETWYFGEEAKTAGFADSVELAGDGESDKEGAFSTAQALLKTTKVEIKNGEREDCPEEIAALLRAEIPTASLEKPEQKSEEIESERLETKEEGKIMNLSEIRSDHPEIYAEILALGVTQERERIMTLRSYTEADPENGKLSDIVNFAIAGGETKGDIDAQIQVAIRDGKKLDGENPPAVATSQPEEVLSDEDAKAASLAGMTHDEYRKYSAMEVK